MTTATLFCCRRCGSDFLLGLGNSDLDFTTDARPEEVIALFRTVIPTGIAHGTVTVIFEGEHYEVTTFRSEGEYKDGRRPSSVTFIPSLEEDLKRRDFTINAFAASAITGKIIDNHNGEQDLKDGTIRAIGNPYERFDEDALRIMRAARISGKLNFTIEDQTFNAMGALKENLRLVSVERLHDELVHLVKSDHPRKGFEYLHASGALAVILPELAQGSESCKKGSTMRTCCSTPSPPAKKRRTSAPPCMFALQPSFMTSAKQPPGNRTATATLLQP